MFQEFSYENSTLKNEIERLKIISTKRLHDIEESTHLNFKLMGRVSLAYIELERLLSNSSKVN